MVDPFDALRESARSAELPAARAREVRRRDAIFPWLLSLAVTLPIAVIAIGIERAVAIGASVALVGGAAICALLVREERREAEVRLRRTEQRLRTAAEDRAALLVRQFGWSVEEVIGLRRRLKVAELREREALEQVGLLEASTDAARGETRRAQQAVFELAAVDVRALRDAADAAVSARKAAERRAEHAERALAISQRQLHAAHQRVADLTRLFASITTAGKLIAAKGEDAGPADAASLGVMWGMGEIGGELAIELRTTQSARALRLRDPAGATLLVKRLEGRGRARNAPFLLPITDHDIAASIEAEPGDFGVEALVGDKWNAARFYGQPRRANTDKRDRVWRRRAPIVRIAG